MDLFEQAALRSKEGPLAARMRPRNLDEYIGQDHIVGKGRLLRRAIQADQLTSVIFYGPPGTGKTTLARVIANHTKSEFITLNAVLTGVQDIRNAIKKADEFHNVYGKKTILFVDEVHRWNKSQQDALLPWVENGTIILIGATTENPFFEVNKALVSRSRIFQLKALTKEDLKKAAENTLQDKERGYGKWNVVFEQGALEHLIETANGDCRSLLNALELAVETTPEVWNPKGNPVQPAFGSEIYISMEAAEESIQKKVVHYDRDGDYHYDIISAFIKSLRGRDPDAAMYWLARMVRAGEDPHFIFRRMLVSSCEDTGLADPMAISVVEGCARAFDRVGMPEGRYFLAHAALYLSTAPKSNSSLAFFDALRSVETEDAEVPNHLKDSSRDAEGFGHGAGYLYPHAYRDHWVAQQYLPDTLAGRVFYTPSSQGYEAKIRDEVLSRRELQIAAILEEAESSEPSKSNSMSKSQDEAWALVSGKKHPNAAQRSATAKSCAQNGRVQKPEQLTFSPDGKKRNEFQRRLDSSRAESLLEIRNTAIELAGVSRHSRCLSYWCDDGLFLWELWRRCPEGFACGICRTEQGKKILDQYASTLDFIEMPQISLSLDEFVDVTFDYVFFKDCVTTKSSFEILARILKDVLSRFPQASLVFAQKIPSKNQRLGGLLKTAFPHKSELIEKVELSEKEFYSLQEEFNWTEEDFINFLSDSGNGGTENSKKSEIKNITEKRKVHDEEIERWLSSQSSYGNFMKEHLSKNDFEEFKTLLTQSSSERIWNWNSTYIFVKI